MQEIQSTPVPVRAPPRRLPLYLIGILLFVIGPALYILQFRMRQLVVPWYVPVLASFGVLCLMASVMGRRGIVRIVGLVLLTVLCGLEWFFLLVLAKSPAYEGPAQVGRPLPTFATTLADGKPLTTKELATGGPTALVFFRGRW